MNRDAYYTYLFVLGLICVSLVALAAFKLYLSPLVLDAFGVEPTGIDGAYSPTSPYELIVALFLLPFAVAYFWAWSGWNPWSES